MDLWGETEGDFNPHSHKGSDNSYLDKDCACSISIHTPTKGVTAVRTLHRLLYFYFNPHSHKGSDEGSRGKKIKSRNFNPHSHKGSDNTARARSSLPCDFNPHSHKGSDVSWLLIILCKIISIHTPTKGVTQFFKRYGK